MKLPFTLEARKAKAEALVDRLLEVTAHHDLQGPTPQEVAKVEGEDAGPPYWVDCGPPRLSWSENAVDDVQGDRLSLGIDQLVALQPMAGPVSQIVYMDYAGGSENPVLTEAGLPSTMADGLQAALDDLSARYSDRLDSRVLDSGDLITLNNLFARKDAPPGTGTAFMRELERIANAWGKTVVLRTAVKDPSQSREFKRTTSQARLARFYRKFGFRSNYGSRSYRSDLPGNMHRVPRTESEEPFDLGDGYSLVHHGGGGFKFYHGGQVVGSLMMSFAPGGRDSVFPERLPSVLDVLIYTSGTSKEHRGKGLYRRALPILKKLYGGVRSSHSGATSDDAAKAWHAVGARSVLTTDDPHRYGGSWYSLEAVKRLADMLLPECR